jgi:hypothetical protein
MKPIGPGRNYSVLTYKKRRRNKRILIVMVALILIFSAYMYFFVLFPNVEKTELPKPDLVEEISEDQVEWMVNELGAYKVHSAPLTNNTPQFNIKLTDTGQIFGVEVVDNEFEFTPQPVSDPDLEISTDSMTFAEIYSADDFETAITKEYYEGNVDIELLRDDAALSLMGYGSIYETFQQGAESI